MPHTSLEFLRKLIATPGVAGREERVRRLIMEEATGLFDEMRVDPMGNLICRKSPRRAGKRSARKVMIACHMDEIGFYVRAIDEQGMIRVQKVGGFEPRNLFARKVLVQGRKDLIGVMNPAIRPIHVASEEEKKKVLEIKDFFVDVFLPRKQVEKLVQVGDPVTWVQDLQVVGDVWTGKAMDDRIAIWVALNAVRKVARECPFELYFVATVQEEVGCRGAGPGACGLEADVAIAVDITLSCDTPGIDKTDAISELGKGVALKVMDSFSISDRELLDEFIALAKKRRIPYQLEVLPLGGTDAGTMQRAGAGRRVFTISVPTRYVHTPIESVHRKDVTSAIDLLAAYLAD